MTQRNLQEGGISSLKSFGIDVVSLLRTGRDRVGEELAFSLKSIDQEMGILSEMMDWWEYAGLGQLSYN